MTGRTVLPTEGVAMTDSSKLRARAWLNERVGRHVRRTKLVRDGLGQQIKVEIVQGELVLPAGGADHEIIVRTSSAADVVVSMWVDPDAEVSTDNDQLRIQLGHNAFVIEVLRTPGH